MRFILTIFILRGVVAFGQAKSDDTICSSRIDTLTNKEVYWPVDNLPTVQGGEHTLLKEVSRRVKYPLIVHENYPIETKVVVAFIVTEDGRLIGKRVIKNIAGTNLGNQLLDILDDFKWEPGQCTGKVVPTFYVFPMIIDLQR